MEAARSQGRITDGHGQEATSRHGKNIVGVVLGCNNYEVIDLGAWFPVSEFFSPREHRARA
jgi:hypothetical protein